MIKKRRWQTENTDDPASFFFKLDLAMRKPLACMRGFRGGVGEIGVGSGPSLKIQTLILHNFFFFFY